MLGVCAGLLASAAVVGAGELTFEDALAKVRAARAGGDGSTWRIVVKGTNFLTRTVVLTPEDHGIEFAGEDGATVSGGGFLAGWRETGKGWWECPIPKNADGDIVQFEQLWAAGRRLTRARYPDVGHIPLPRALCTAETNGAGRVSFVERAMFDDARIDALRSVTPDELPFAQLCLIVKWQFARRTIRRYDPGERTVVTHGFNVWHPWQAWISPSAREALASFENVRVGFDSPGEWFYDAMDGKVLYRPLPGEEIETFRAVAPVSKLSKLVSLRGDWAHGDFVRNIRFSNIAFCHSDATQLDGRPANAPAETVQHQAASGSDGLIALTGAHNVVFDGCRFAHTGNYAMRFGSGCMSNKVVNSTFADLGAGAVWMGADYRYEDRISEIPRKVLYPNSPEATAYNLISNNVISQTGRFNPEGVGIILTHCSDTKVVHNDIHDCLYTGITVGWTWGFFGSVSQRNEIAFNRIWDLGKNVMSDMGGIYLLGTSFGTSVHDNVVHDVCSPTYGGCGIYLDEGAEGIVVERNLVWNTTHAGLQQHFGSGCVVRNNIFAFNRKNAAVSVHRKYVQGVPCPLHFLRNIVVVSEGALVEEGARGMHEVGGVWADNLWYDFRGLLAATFDQVDWKAWSADPLETGGVFADPRFEDARGFDFRLKADSPAWALGFVPFDSSLAGSTLNGGTK